MTTKTETKPAEMSLTMKSAIEAAMAYGNSELALDRAGASRKVALCMAGQKLSEHVQFLGIKEFTSKAQVDSIRKPILAALSKEFADTTAAAYWAAIAQASCIDFAVSNKKSDAQADSRAVVKKLAEKSTEELMTLVAAGDSAAAKAVVAKAGAAKAAEKAKLSEDKTACKKRISTFSPDALAIVRVADCPTLAASRAIERVASAKDLVSLQEQITKRIEALAQAKPAPAKPAPAKKSK